MNGLGQFGQGGQGVAGHQREHPLELLDLILHFKKTGDDQADSAPGLLQVIIQQPGPRGETGVKRPAMPMGAMATRFLISTSPIFTGSKSLSNLFPMVSISPVTGVFHLHFFPSRDESRASASVRPWRSESLQSLIPPLLR